MGAGAPLKTPNHNHNPLTLMTRDLALSLLRSGNDGAEILQILDTIADTEADANIADCAAHYAAISAPTADPIQF